MTIYTVVCGADGSRVAMLHDGNVEYFAGYDFMGSVDWTNDSSEARVMGLEEAEQIADDLTAGE